MTISATLDKLLGDVEAEGRAVADFVKQEEEKLAALARLRLGLARKRLDDVLAALSGEAPAGPAAPDLPAVPDLPATQQPVKDGAKAEDPAGGEGRVVVFGPADEQGPG